MNLAQTQKDSSDKLFDALEEDRPDLINKWVVINKGKLLGAFQTQTEAMDFAMEHIPDGEKGIVSQLGIEKIKKRYHIR